MALELDPSQPPAITRLVVELLAEDTARRTPGGRPGIDEALDPPDGAAQAGVAVRNSRGADRA